MTPDEIREFVRTHHHCVLVTRRRDGGLQTSPVVCGVGDDGTVHISVTQDRAKTRNLRRDQRATLCVFTDKFFGQWVQVEGAASIIDLPEAMPHLKALYRQVSGGDHPDWNEFEEAMVRDRRCIISVPVGG
jgi:PPOX class probable F420-dependent enzyme